MNFDEAHKHVDEWLSEEARLARKGEAQVDAKTRLAIDKVLERALDKADPITADSSGRQAPEPGDERYGRSERETCVNCSAHIENWQGRWVDAGTHDLVYCTDQDETQDGVRHAPA